MTSRFEKHENRSSRNEKNLIMNFTSIMCTYFLLFTSLKLRDCSQAMATLIQRNIITEMKIHWQVKQQMRQS